jgi:hypothetical protein
MVLWQAVSRLRASERPSDESGKHDTSNNEGIIHHRVPGRPRIGIVE